VSGPSTQTAGEAPTRSRTMSHRTRPTLRPRISVLRVQESSVRLILDYSWLGPPQVCDGCHMDDGYSRQPWPERVNFANSLLASSLTAWYKRQTVESSVASRTFESLVACPASKVLNQRKSKRFSWNWPRPRGLRFGDRAPRRVCAFFARTSIKVFS